MSYTNFVGEPSNKLEMGQGQGQGVDWGPLQ